MPFLERHIGLIRTRDMEALLARFASCNQPDFNKNLEADPCLRGGVRNCRALGSPVTRSFGSDGENVMADHANGTAIAEFLGILSGELVR